MRVQSGRLAQQDDQGHQGHPDLQQALVFLDLLDGQVLQAFRVHLEYGGLLEDQVIDFCLLVIYVFIEVDYTSIDKRSRY